MGLDITAYKNLHVVENPELDEEGYPSNWESEWMPGAGVEWSEENFPGRAPELKCDAVYGFEDSYDFRAGSYSGYGWWRDKLEEFARDDDFYELIEFADNEGAIGASVSAKLYEDFIRNRADAEKFQKTITDDDGWWLEQYDKWTTAFSYAKENGAVDFH